MALEDRYEVAATAAYIGAHGFSRVALQFPDELLVDSVAVSSALQSACGSSVRLFVMADTTYGSCCVDEVAAAHVDAECVIHYGRACLSPVTRLPVWYVFGRASLQMEKCLEVVANLAATSDPLLVLYDLEYAHAIPNLREAVQRPLHSKITFAEVVGREMKPCDATEDLTADSNQHYLGGLKWEAPTMENCTILWIGKEGPALTNVLLTYNSATTVRYDPESGNQINMANKSSTLWRRYYLIERAKDADIVGIVVGTLGVSGYNQAIQKVKQMVKSAGKKSYTLAVGKPNPAKLANFPECDVFVLVACPQTALVESKEYFAPLLTTFEAQLAFTRGAQWTGSYCLDFRKVQILTSGPVCGVEEPRFSFIKGGYVSSTATETQDDETAAAAALVVDRSSSTKAVSISTKSNGPQTAADFFTLRSFQGLQIDADAESTEGSKDYKAVTGRKGRAAVYEHEHE